MLIKCKKIFVILGDDCNLSCRYCIQNGIKKRGKKVKPQKEVIEWIDKECALTDKTVEVCFFGGEPLLYFDAIKEFVGYHKAENVHFTVITNGKALSAEMVNFFNAHNVGVGISWDGENSHYTRGYDVFDEKTGNKENVLSLNGLGVSAVISSKAYPYDVLKSMQEIDDEYYAIHKSHISPHTDFIFGCNLPDKKMSDLDYGKLKSQVKEIMKEYDRFLKGETVSPCVVQWVANYFENYLSSMSSDSPYCQNGKQILNVDLNGNLYFCHNTREIIGTIYSREDRYLARVKALESMERKQKEDCSKCPVHGVCNICCKLIPKDKVEDCYCKIRREAFSPISDYINNDLAKYAKGGIL